MGKAWYQKTGREMLSKKSVTGNGTLWITKYFTPGIKRNQKVAIALHTPSCQIQKSLFWTARLTVHWAFLPCANGELLLRSKAI